MKLAICNVTVCGKKERVSKDGNSKYYSLVLSQDGDVLTFPCSEAVFNQVVQFSTYEYMILNYEKSEYNNTLYTRMMLCDVKATKKA